MVSRNDGDYRTSTVDNSFLAVKNLNDFGLNIGGNTEIKSPNALASSYFVIILMSIVLLGAIVVFYFFVFRIFGKINRDMQLMDKCIENDFTTRIPVKSRDEIGQIEHQFNRMLDKVDTLKKILL